MPDCTYPYTCRCSHPPAPYTCRCSHPPAPYVDLPIRCKRQRVPAASSNVSNGNILQVTHLQSTMAADDTTRHRMCHSTQFPALTCRVKVSSRCKPRKDRMAKESGGAQISSEWSGRAHTNHACPAAATGRAASQGHPLSTSAHLNRRCAVDGAAVPQLQHRPTEFGFKLLTYSFARYHQQCRTSRLHTWGWSHTAGA
jgi:hypothetical protein